MFQASRLQILSFIVALIATVGSLIFSEILKYPPCVLCWYQRICMYPLVAILFAAIWSEDRKQAKYTLPLIAIGFAIAVYHNLLYYEFLPESIQPCKEGVSCTSKHIEWFGFITIPLLSLIAFVILGIFEAMTFTKGMKDEK